MLSQFFVSLVLSVLAVGRPRRVTVGQLVVRVFAQRSGSCGFDSPAGSVNVGQLVVRVLTWRSGSSGFNCPEWGE